MRKSLTKIPLCLFLPVLLFLLVAATPIVHAQGAPKPIRVCATVPDLGDLVREIGGDQVLITVFAKGKEDPHFIEAKPSFIKALSQADLFIQVGMELEVGWVPVLLQNARNGQVLPGAMGHLDASRVITAMEIPTGTLDRSMGDVHPMGNPHYLLDPLNGLQVARRIREKLVEIRPEKKTFFEERYQVLYRKLGNAMVGERLAKKYPLEKLAVLFEEKKLAEFLKGQGEAASLEGWLGRMLPSIGRQVVADHNMWPYFAHRFGISVAGFLEPKPGVAPTTKHLQTIIEKMRKEGIKLILASPYFDIRHGQFVSKNTGAKIIPMAHQVGSRPGADNYLNMIDYNVRQVAEAF